MLDNELVIKILAVASAIGTLLHQVISRDRARANEIAQCVKRDELEKILHNFDTKLDRFESRLDDIYKMLASKK